MGRLYRDPVTGMRWPSVTTIIGQLGSREIVQWAANLAAETGNRHAHREVMEERGAEGSRVHAAIHNGNWVGIRAYQRQFARAWEARPFEVLSFEQAVWSPTYEYAGTYDMVVRFLDTEERVMLDVKTNRSGVRPDRVGLQLAAYRYADTAPPVDGVGVLWLRPDTYRWYDEDEIPAGREEFDAFLALRSVYAWLHR